MGIVNYLLVICFSFLLFWISRERERTIRYRILRLLVCSLLLLLSVIGSMAFVIVGLGELAAEADFWYYADMVVVAGALLGLAFGLWLSPKLIRERKES